MDELILNITIVPTFDVLSLSVLDISDYPIPSGPGPRPVYTFEITVPGFETVTVPFYQLYLNLYFSDTLGITETGVQQPLPDGIYCFKYSVDIEGVPAAEKNIMRVDRLQARFDEAFMQLDMMECDQAIKTQSKVELSTIYFFIQGSIAAANNCDPVTANKLYNKASKMLDTFINNNCGCSGNNYLINFQ
jgi:hypothetical protein